MDVEHITPILNVSNLEASFEWFEKLGWKKLWDWGEPKSFGSVGAGQSEIFLCVDAQGGRGTKHAPSTFGPDGDEESDVGVWMSVFVSDVDAIYAVCQTQGIEVCFPPTDMPWGVRELHIRHPDGHIFRVSGRPAEGGSEES